MESATVVLLLAAGLFGGVINAVAGGATLITFPALVAAGLPPVLANATSSLALTPGHLFAVAGERKQLPKLDTGMWFAMTIAVAGGLFGAYLLMNSSERLFTRLVPLLIGGATLVFAFGKPLQEIVLGKGAISDRPMHRVLSLVPVAVYGGYFGAGMGVVMMAAFALTSAWALRTANAVKNLLSALANWAAIIVFAWAGMIDWTAALTMLAGACAGGLLGARLLRTLPASFIRYIVIGTGTVMTVIYARSYWF